MNELMYFDKEDLTNLECEFIAKLNYKMHIDPNSLEKCYKLL